MEQASQQASALPMMSPEQIPESVSAEQVLGLQRQIGNAATRRMLVQRATRTGPKATTYAAEKSPFSLTGSYSFDNGNQRGTLNINHGGAGLTGTLQVRQMGKDPSGGKQPYYSIKSYRITGTRYNDVMTKDNQSFKASLDGEHDVSLDFWREKGGGVSLQFEGNNETLYTASMKRVSQRPTLQLNEAAIGGKNKDAFIASMKMPLDAFQKKQIRTHCNEIKQHVKNYFSYWAHVARSAEAGQISIKLGAFVEQFPIMQRPLIAREIRRILTNEVREKRSYFDELGLIVNRESKYTEKMQKILGIGPNSEANHKYKFSMEVGGLGGDLIVGAQVFGGRMLIEKTEPDTWSHTYSLAIAGFSIGASASLTVAMNGSGTMESRQPWTPTNFGGFIGFGSGQAQFSVYGGKGIATSAVVFQGNGDFRAIVGNASGSFDIGGAAVGVETGASIGYIHPWDVDVISGLREIYKPPQAAKTEVAQKAKQSVHFEVDSADLSKKGKGLLRSLATDNLGLFRDPNSKLEIDGYASRSGPDKYNAQLSEARAQTVYNFLQSVLTDDFRIKKGNVTVKGHGEQAAAKAGEDDKKENRAWRRTTVKLNGTTVLRLQ